MRFIDRAEAGQQLAKRVNKYRRKAVIYGLPRGGVVVAAEVARELAAPLDLILVRKIGHPSHEEYAIGAVAEGGEPVFNESERARVDEDWLRAKLKDLQAENTRRRREYFPPNYKEPDVAGKTAIIIDDGIATGLTMRAAAEAIAQRRPKKLIVAAPVAPQDSINELKEAANEVVVLSLIHI